MWFNLYEAGLLDLRDLPIFTEDEAPCSFLKCTYIHIYIYIYIYTYISKTFYLLFPLHCIQEVYPYKNQYRGP